MTNYCSKCGRPFNPKKQERNIRIIRGEMWRGITIRKENDWIVSENSL